jgi:hypothetical protein
MTPSHIERQATQADERLRVGQAECPHRERPLRFTATFDSSCLQPYRELTEPSGPVPVSALRLDLATNDLKESATLEGKGSTMTASS